MAPRFELDAAVRRRDDGRLLVGGTPPRLLRLSEKGVRALDAILAGDDLDAPASKLARRLEGHGVIHPMPGDGAGDPEVTAIVPVLDGGQEFAGLIATLAAEGPVIVVDDGSHDDSAARAERAGARVLRHDRPRGPAAARNAGLAAANTDLVAFLDADCVVAPGWRAGLASLIEADPELAVVAPRIRSTPGQSLLARYERGASPLDLGPAPSLVGASRRISYLPSAALIARRSDLLAIDGFEESMRFGEDVDLIWRLLRAGERARYVPSREVLHLPRSDLSAFTAQRAGYGGSAPDLHLRHPGHVAPLRVGPHPAGVWTALVVFGPRALPAALSSSLFVLASRGQDLASRTTLAQLGLQGHGTAARHLARALSREWLPVTLALAVRGRRARTALAAAFLVDAWPSLKRASGPTELLATAGLGALDRAAYATGLWRASIQMRTLGALLPFSPPGPLKTDNGPPSRPYRAEPDI